MIIDYLGIVFIIIIVILFIVTIYNLIALNKLIKDLDKDMEELDKWK